MKNSIYFFLLSFSTLLFCGFVPLHPPDKEKQRFASLNSPGFIQENGLRNLWRPWIIHLAGLLRLPACRRGLGTLQRFKENIIVLSLFMLITRNRLGWKDPFGSKAFTERQYNYGSAMNSPGIYSTTCY